MFNLFSWISKKKTDFILFFYICESLLAYFSNQSQRNICDFSKGTMMCKM